MAVSAGQGCWSKQRVRDVESSQSGGGEPSMLPALGTSGDVWTWCQIFSTSVRFSSGPPMDLLVSQVL